MLLTAKPLTVTLSSQEQRELRRYMEDPSAQFGTRISEFEKRFPIVLKLEEKGYLKRMAIHEGFIYHKINPEA